MINSNSIAIGEDVEYKLLMLLRECETVLKFDFEECDFGPALGLMEERKRKLMENLDNVLKSD